MSTPDPHTLWRHLKSGHVYLVIDLGVIEATMTEATAAARDVLTERERQQSVEGWTPEHDDAHVNVLELANR